MTLQRRQLVSLNQPFWREMLDANIYVSVLVLVCNGRWWVNNVADGLLRCSTARGQQSRADQSKTRGRKSGQAPETAVRWWRTRRLQLPAY